MAKLSHPGTLVSLITVSHVLELSLRTLVCSIGCQLTSTQAKKSSN